GFKSERTVKGPCLESGNFASFQLFDVRAPLSPISRAHGETPSASEHQASSANSGILQDCSSFFRLSGRFSPGKLCGNPHRAYASRSRRRECISPLRIVFRTES